MRKFYPAFIILFLAFSPVFGQKYKVNIQYVDYTADKNSDTIYYDTQQRLTWDDFHGKADDDYKVNAMTASGIGYNTRATSDGEYITLNVNVFTFFLKSASWKKNSSMQSAGLEHEQRHFDMTFLGALKFVESLKSIRPNPKTFESQVRTLYMDAYRSTKDAQQQFDKLTNHGEDARAQTDWNRQIREMIVSAIGASK